MPRGVWIAVAAVVLALGLGVLVLDRRQAARGTPSLLAVPWSRPPASGRGPAARGAPPPEPRHPRRPARRVALLVDELGARRDVFDEVVALGRTVSVGVLPELPLSRTIARDADRAGLEVLLQLPLEPYRYPEADPGPGVLLTAMPPAEVERRTRRYLASLPEATGVTTAMGSRFTEDRSRMRAVLETVGAAGRFFVDGFPSTWSVGYDLARALGVPAARRQLLLDPEEEESAVRARLARVEAEVARRGAVLAIAHGRRLTLRLLAEAVPRWEAGGIRVVPVSALVERPAGVAPVAAEAGRRP